MSEIHLVLFFTRGVSLEIWDKVGMFAREVSLYKRLQKHGVDITFVTYGKTNDLRYADRLPGINICCNRLGLPARLYEKLIPWLHRKTLRRSDLFKTNQTNGADIALRCAQYYTKPLIARCGYMWSKNLILEHGRDSDSVNNSLSIEELVFTTAQHIVVTTSEIKQNVLDRFPSVGDDHVTVIPNYVDTDVFQPKDKRTEHRHRLCYVGRLSPEKNLDTLLHAITEMDIDLEIIGDGPMRKSLEAQAACNAGIHFYGHVPNEQLPDFFHRSTAFVFPSLYEGHPKTPIEAMACGLPIIATDVSGINEVVSHNQTGWLCGTDPESLREGIMTVLASRYLRERLGRQARQFVVEHFSLDRIVELELGIYHSVLQGYN